MEKMPFNAELTRTTTMMTTTNLTTPAPITVP